MKGKILLVSILALLSAASLLFLPLIGVDYFSPFDVLNLSPGSVDYEIFWNLRVPRVCYAWLAGASLSLGGVIFQGLFRNPLASPYTLGVSSGAAFGAALALKLGIDWNLIIISGTTLFAMVGSVATIALVLSLARSMKTSSGVTMLLSGVVVSFFFGSLIILLQYLSNFVEVFRITRWLMGSVEVAGFEQVRLLLPIAFIGLLAAFRYSRELNLISLGEEVAQTRGVQLVYVERVLFISVSLMVGAVVSLCGPIGFVGIIVPHTARLLSGNNHRWLIPVSFLFGGLFLAVCDTIGRTCIAPSEIPVGVITALLGGPFFLWLLAKR